MTPTMPQNREDESVSDIAALLQENQKLREDLAKQMRRATDAEYMKRAYRNMLGPKGSAVADMWEKRGVKRVHFDWQPEAWKMSGEERAEFILGIEDSPRRPLQLGEIDNSLRRAADAGGGTKP